MPSVHLNHFCRFFYGSLVIYIDKISFSQNMQTSYSTAKPVNTACNWCRQCISIVRRHKLKLYTAVQSVSRGSGTRDRYLRVIGDGGSRLGLVARMATTLQ